MRKKTGIVFVVLGAVLLIAALLSVLYNEYRDKRAGENADVLLDELRSLIAEQEDKTEKATAPDTESAESPNNAENTGLADEAEQTETVTETSTSDNEPIKEPAPINVGGYDCIGYIEIPSLSLTLPVMSDWDYAKLDVAPCRHFGSAVSDDLVIAGHNFKRHFSYLSRLGGDETVLFTDTAGRVYTYRVTSVKNVRSDAVEDVQLSGHDLVLYTCTFIGNIRTAVFCDRAT